MEHAPFTGDLDLDAVRSRDQLAELLRAVHARADKPSLRTLETRTRHEVTPLSKTVISEMLSGARFPRKAVMITFLRACGIPDEDTEPWRRAWERMASSDHRQSSVGVGAGERDHTARSGDRPLRAPSPPTPVVAAAEDMASDHVRWREQVDYSDAAAEDQRQPPHEMSAALDVEAPRPADEANLSKRNRNPVVMRRELGAMLRALRVGNGLTIEQVAEHLLCSPSKVSRMEGGNRAVTPRDVRDLCDLYGVTDAAQRQQFMEIARNSRQHSWWQSYDLPFSTYLGLEADATTIRSFHSTLIPVLLQTADYARSRHQLTAESLEEEAIEQRVEVIQIRQRLLTQPDPPRFWAVIDEAALHRVVGRPEVMKAQLARLEELSALPNVLIQVISFQAGAHPGTDSTFTILGFADPTPSVVYVEGLVGAIYLERPDDIERYSRVFETLTLVANPPKQSIDLIRKVATNLEDKELARATSCSDTRVCLPKGFTVTSWCGLDACFRHMPAACTT